MNDFVVPDLLDDEGSLRDFDYFVNGIKVRSKADVFRAVKNKTKRIIRINKIDKTKTQFNHQSLSFE